MTTDLKSTILHYLNGAPDVGAPVCWIMEDLGLKADPSDIAEALVDLVSEDKIFKGPGDRIYPVMVNHG